MALPIYPEVKNLDDLFGFSAARKKAEETSGIIDTSEEASFLPHRIFFNQLDSYNAKHISSFLADQLYGTPQKEIGEEEGGEEEEEAEAENEEAIKAPKEVKPMVNYQIIGTLVKSFHKKTEDVLFTVKEDSENFLENVMKCGFLIYDITKDPDEIPKALTTLAAIDAEIEKWKELGPKTFKNIQELRVFILVSTVMTWALTKPIDPEDPELPFTEADYKKRKPHPNYKEHFACEKEVILKGRKFKDKLKTYVVASGIVYGAEEDDLTSLFKLAWYNEPELPCFLPGKNNIPLIHIKDLAKVLYGIINKKPRKQYILAVEQTPAKLKQIVKALTKSMGTGKIKEVSAQEAFLYPEITQTVFERLTVNLLMEPGIIVEELEVEWQNELNLAENMDNIVNEFKTALELKPKRIILHGPPGVGKSRISKQLAECYGAHTVSIQSVIDYTLRTLKESIDKIIAAALAKEEKAKTLEEGGDLAEDAGVEEEEGEEEEEEVSAEELEEQLKEIQNTMAESENGKLPDEQVINLFKTFISSNCCQNQGYILDGYPKTMEQTRVLFGGGEGEEEEEAGEEEGEEAGGPNKLLPEYVISLQATDEFLCERIMSLPEREIQGTHYTEEHMLRRLAEFRTNNTEDNTLLNYFDEIEIHPIVIDVMNDKTYLMENTMQIIKNRLGKAVSFPITAEEEEKLLHLEEERQRLLEKEAQMTRELLEQQAVEDYQNKMEQWTELLEQLQIEEEKVLVAQAEPLRHYLMKFVFPTLSKGLLEVARLKPDDPVDFLAEYLFKQNPEGRMFDPAYTRDGKRIMDTYKERVEHEIKRLDSSSKQT